MFCTHASVILPIPLYFSAINVGLGGERFSLLLKAKLVDLLVGDAEHVWAFLRLLALTPALRAVRLQVYKIAFLFSKRKKGNNQ